MRPGLVEAELDFDKNPRLATVVGFLLYPRLPATTVKTHEQNHRIRKNDAREEAWRNRPGDEGQ
jgi:hypothetical protein